MRVNTLQEIIVDGQAAGPGNPVVEITDGHGKLCPSLAHPEIREELEITLFNNNN